MKINPINADNLLFNSAKIHQISFSRYGDYTEAEETDQSYFALVASTPTPLPVQTDRAMFCIWGTIGRYKQHSSTSNVAVYVVKISVLIGCRLLLLPTSISLCWQHQNRVCRSVIIFPIYLSDWRLPIIGRCQNVTCKYRIHAFHFLAFQSDLYTDDTYVSIDNELKVNTRRYKISGKLTNVHCILYNQHFILSADLSVVQLADRSWQSTKIFWEQYHLSAEESGRFLTFLDCIQEKPNMNLNFSNTAIRYIMFAFNLIFVVSTIEKLSTIKVFAYKTSSR